MTFRNNQIDLAALPTIEDIQMDPIDKRYYKVLLLNHGILYIALIALAIGLPYMVTKLSWMPYIVLVLPMLCFGILLHAFVVRKGFSQRKYGLREHDISYAHGWVTAKHYTLPFVRTQHVEINQGLFSKYYKVANLKVYTAGDGDDVHIKGLSAQRAEELRTFIISKINNASV